MRLWQEGMLLPCYLSWLSSASVLIGGRSLCAPACAWWWVGGGARPVRWNGKPSLFLLLVQSIIRLMGVARCGCASADVGPGELGAPQAQAGTQSEHLGHVVAV